jgi:hypothetical protein
MEGSILGKVRQGTEEATALLPRIYPNSRVDARKEIFSLETAAGKKDSSFALF